MPLAGRSLTATIRAAAALEIAVLAALAVLSLAALHGPGGWVAASAAQADGAVEEKVANVDQDAGAASRFGALGAIY